MSFIFRKILQHQLTLLMKSQRLYGMAFTSVQSPISSEYSARNTLNVIKDPESMLFFRNN